MTDADGKWAITPASGDGMDIRTADTAALDLDVNVTVFELLWFELKRSSMTLIRKSLKRGNAHLLLFEVCPFALVLDHETLKGIRVAHYEVVYRIDDPSYFYLKESECTS